MFNNYTMQVKRSNHQKSLSLGEFAELKGVNADSLQQLFVNDTTINAAFNRRNKNYYHETALNSWWSVNGHKVMRL